MLGTLRAPATHHRWSRKLRARKLRGKAASGPQIGRDSTALAPFCLKSPNLCRSLILRKEAPGIQVQYRGNT